MGERESAKTITLNFIGTTAEWEKSNMRLPESVLGFEKTTAGGLFLKVGNGRDRWNELKYFDGENIKGLSEKLKECESGLASLKEADEIFDERIASETKARKESDESLYKNINEEARLRRESDEQETREREESDEKISQRINLLAPEGLEDIPGLLEQQTRAREEAIQDIRNNFNNELIQTNNNLQALQESHNAWIGRGGYLDEYDFDTSDPAQQQLTEYALSRIPNITDPLDIWNSTKVKNKTDGHIWILTNTQDTDPPVFEWSDNGPGVISPFADNVGGYIKGAVPEDPPDYIRAVAGGGGKAKIDIEKLGKIFFLAAHPVNSIYMTVAADESTPAQMAAKYGGAWQVWGAGRVPVSLNVNDPLFSTVEKTGGKADHSLTAAESGLPSHSHVQEAHQHKLRLQYGATANANFNPNGQYAQVSPGGDGFWVNDGHNAVELKAPGIYDCNAANASQAHNNLQPYIVCYIYKRTS